MSVSVRGRSDSDVPLPLSSCRGIVSPPPSYGRYGSAETSSTPIIAILGSQARSASRRESGGHDQQRWVSETEKTAAWLRHSSASMRQAMTSARSRRAQTRRVRFIVNLILLLLLLSYWMSCYSCSCLMFVLCLIKINIILWSRSVC